MKLRHFLSVFAAFTLFAAISTPLFADPDSFTSQEWFSIPKNARTSIVSTAKYRLADQGVPLSKSLEEYIEEVNDYYKSKPDALARSVSEILPALVYANEPEAKIAMDELIKKKRIDPIVKL